VRATEVLHSLGFHTTAVQAEISMTTPTVPPEPFTLQAEDGGTFKGFFWRHSGDSGGTRPVVTIHPQTIFSSA